MSAEIHQLLPTDAERLETLATEINRELATATKSALESAIKIGESLIEAKTIAGHGKFIPWLKENFQTVERQAQKYMRVARHADTLRANTNSEFVFDLNAIPTLLRLRDDPEDIETPKFIDPKTTKPSTPKPPTEQRQRAFDAYDRIKDSGETPTKRKVQKESGVSFGTVQTVFALREGQQPSPAPLPELPKTAQQKLEAWQRQLEADFDHRVRQASQKWLTEHRLPIYEKKLEEIEQMFNPRNSLMVRAEYNTIRKCLHPDSRHTRSDKDMDEAWLIIQKYHPRLVSDEESRRAMRSTLPTVEEMLARKGTKK